MAPVPLRAVLALLLGVPLLLLAAAAPAQACSCIELSADRMLGSDAAFAGTVEDSRAGVTRFAVDRVWSGDVAERTEVVHASVDAACGLSTREGDRMVVSAAYDEDGDLRTSLCSVLVGDEAVDRTVAALGAGRAPGTGLIEATGRAADKGPPLVPIGVATVLVVVVAGLLGHRLARRGDRA